MIEAIIMVLIMDQPLCVPCIAEQANLSTADTGRYLQTIGKMVDVRADEGHCRDCGSARRVFSVRPMALAFRKPHRAL